ncbi:hypothetical protein KUTeg_016356 [Tegillarca granosa]|uniref:Uncharacterized protein n=1 Tax=Tegillarca granosa TaxID=220873 RepID=A0ABQ9EKL6_TEGGR|nr:hypothetical protein KUTeg_016356 [Tegillarca granosa]
MFIMDTYILKHVVDIYIYIQLPSDTLKDVWINHHTLFRCESKRNFLVSSDFLGDHIPRCEIYIKYSQNPICAVIYNFQQDSHNKLLAQYLLVVINYTCLKIDLNCLFSYTFCCNWKKKIHYKNIYLNYYKIFI